MKITFKWKKRLNALAAEYALGTISETDERKLAILQKLLRKPITREMEREWGIKEWKMEQDRKKIMGYFHNTERTR